MTTIKDTIGVVLMLSLSATVACNSKSPETTEDSSEVDPSTTQASNADATPEPKEPPRPDPLPSLEGPHTTAFDLTNNRPLAHVIRGSAVVVDAGQPDFVRYVHGDHPGHWELERMIEGKKGAALDRRRDSSIWVPALAPGPATLEIEVFNPARGDNNLTLEVNDQELDSRALSAGWQTVRWELPAQALKLENEIEITFSNLGRIDGDLSGGAFGHIRLGEFEELPNPVASAGGADAGDASGDTADGGEAAPQVAAVDAGGEVDGGDKVADGQNEQPESTWLPAGQGAFELARDEGLAWYVSGLDDASVELEIEAPVGCGVTVALATEDGEGGMKQAQVTELLLVETHGGVQRGAGSYGIPRSEVGRLVVRHAGDCESVKILSGGVKVPGAPKVRDEIPKPKRIIVWMIDTLRSDYLPIHFDTDVEAPNLKRLAEEGASFKWAYVQGNESRTSHASFFTGMFPSRHRVLGRGHLKPWHELLPEALQEQGYETGAYISNGYVSKPWGFVQGWDYYRNNLRENYGIDGEAMAEDGIEWAKKNADKPFFLYLGTIDPHVTYRRHEDIIDQYDPEPYNGRFRRYCLGTDLGKIKGGGIKVTERDKERIIALYKNEITFNDRAFGQLRSALESEGLWEDTLVVVTSDHGDEFWEHGSVGHGHNVYGELVHVPIIINYPRAIPAGTTLESGADVLDIYPTILDFAGAEPNDDIQGKSLLGLIDGVHGGYPEPSIATQYLMHYGVQIGRWKLYLRKGSYEVFDRDNDLVELEDVSSKHPFASRQLLDAAGWFRPNRDRWKKASWGVPSNLSANFWERLNTPEDE